MRKTSKSGWAVLAISCSAALFAAARSFADDSTPDHPVLVEMFLSQACKASPPAAAYLTRLRSRPDLVVLDWHVDYWNFLTNGEHGRWRDPYSKPEFTDRQRAYNASIRRRATVFTPQAIIDGVASAVGSKPDQVEAKFDHQEPRVPVDIKAVPQGDTLAITVDKHAPGLADVLLVTFRKTVDTDITGGDNAGTSFHEENVVTEVARLGSVTLRAETFSAPVPAEGMGCAILVQAANQGPVLGARYCAP